MERSVEDISDVVGSLIAGGFCLLTMFVMLSVLCSIITDEGQANAVSLIDNMTTEIPVSYQNITVLDKNAEERSLLSDTYNVVFATESGEIIKLNNMTVYYSVEKGHTYNASFTYGFQDIVGEVN